MAAEPYNVDAEISGLCNTGLHASILTGVILRLMTGHFADAEHISDPELTRFIWDADPSESKILIVPVWQWATPGSQQRPAIVVKRNALRVQQLGLSDGEAVLSGPDLDSVPANATANCQVGMIGSHTVFAIATLAAQAERLGAEIATRLIQYANAIKSELGFHRCRVAEIGAINKLEESSETFVVPVTVAYKYVNAWTVWSEAPFLKRLVVETR